MIAIDNKRIARCHVSMKSGLRDRNNDCAASLTGVDYIGRSQ